MTNLFNNTSNLHNQFIEFLVHSFLNGGFYFRDLLFYHFPKRIRWNSVQVISFSFDIVGAVTSSKFSADLNYKGHSLHHVVYSALILT